MLLERLGIPFETSSPQVDESAVAGEQPAQLVQRLALRKAEAVAAKFAHAIVIGSDQLAAFENSVVGKPGSLQKAHSQLAAFSGKEVLYLTAFTVLHANSGRQISEIVETIVRFRDLNPAEIDRYLEFDNPVDCAGSFKSESAGISLFRSMKSEDPTALIGLPLIKLCSALRKFGISIP